MSCRVLKRGVERLLLNDIVAAARERGLSAVEGEYIPTAKNGLVKEHYRELGFAEIGANADGRTRWQLDVGEGWEPARHLIAVRAPV